MRTNNSNGMVDSKDLPQIKLNNICYNMRDLDFEIEALDDEIAKLTNLRVKKKKQVKQLRNKMYDILTKHNGILTR